MMKHSKIKDAAFQMENARERLLDFQRELKDVNLPLELRMEVGGFLSLRTFSSTDSLRIIWCSPGSGKRGSRWRMPFIR